MKYTPGAPGAQATSSTPPESPPLAKTRTASSSGHADGAFEPPQHTAAAAGTVDWPCFVRHRPSQREVRDQVDDRQVGEQVAHCCTRRHVDVEIGEERVGVHDTVVVLLSEAQPVAIPIGASGAGRVQVRRSGRELTA
jgi:hypothetical protein